MRSHLLFVDALLNLTLGVGLVWFPSTLVRALGIPDVAPAFYASILGAVLFGIGLALLLELRTRSRSTTGLGLGGAVAINLSGGVGLAGWLIAGGLDLPLRGRVFLWALVAGLVSLSAVELAAQSKSEPARSA